MDKLFKSSIVETHAHLYSEKFLDDLDLVIDRGEQSGISHYILPNIDSESIESMMLIEEKYPNCFATMGLHPCSVGNNIERELQVVEDWLSKREFTAVGEIGTDLYWDKTYWEQQKEAFSIQCEWAIEYDLPVIIHCRESIDETIQLVEAINNPKLRGVFHCFTGSRQQADRITALGFKLGVGGVVTFKKSGLKKTLEEVNLEHLVLETDSPYLAPTPNRGKRNEPSYLKYVIRSLSYIYSLGVEQVIQATTSNALKLFGLEK